MQNLHIIGACAYYSAFNVVRKDNLCDFGMQNLHVIRACV
jgi:hypothetical protein